MQTMDTLKEEKSQRTKDIFSNITGVRTYHGIMMANNSK